MRLRGKLMIPVLLALGLMTEVQANPAIMAKGDKLEALVSPVWQLKPDVQAAVAALGYDLSKQLVVGGNVAEADKAIDLLPYGSERELWRGGGGNPDRRWTYQALTRSAIRFECARVPELNLVVIGTTGCKTGAWVASVSTGYINPDGRNAVPFLKNGVLVEYSQSVILADRSVNKELTKYRAPEVVVVKPERKHRVASRGRRNPSWVDPPKDEAVKTTTVVVERVPVAVTTIPAPSVTIVDAVSERKGTAVRTVSVNPPSGRPLVVDTRDCPCHPAQIPQDMPRGLLP